MTAATGSVVVVLKVEVPVDVDFSQSSHAVSWYDWALLDTGRLGRTDKLEPGWVVTVTIGPVVVELVEVDPDASQSSHSWELLNAGRVG